MLKLSTYAAGILAFGLAGCISLEPKRFSAPVQARQLHDIPPPGQTVPAPVAALAQPAAATPAETAAAPAPPPARTNIRGAGDGSTKVDRIVVTGNVKEIPHRVPDFSREQLAGMVCRGQGSRNPQYLGKVVRAWEATVAAHDSRIAYEAGRITLKEANAIEIARQDAVKAFRGTEDFFASLLGGLIKKSDLPKPQSGSLVLENVDLFTFTENGIEVMAVSGVVRNTGVSTAEVPPLTLQSIDQWDYLLAGQTSLLSFETLGPGESRPFEVRFLNPPDTTAEVYAHFAPPFEYRAYRACDNFDPRTAKPRTADEAPQRDDGPVHTSAELNELTRYYRAEAENAWICRPGRDSSGDKDGGLRIAVAGSGERREGGSISLGKPDMNRLCAGFGARLRWRDMFVLAEATDEAWGAMRASEETQRKVGAGIAPQSEAEAARLAWDSAHRRVRTLGEAALARAGGSTAGIAVNLSSSSFGNGGGYYYVEIAGTLRNTGDAPRDVDALMLAIVDRLEMPLLSFAIDNPATLAPGQMASFSQRIRLEDPGMMRSGSPPGSGPWGSSPGWQIRVGAMGR
jgi:hypothetical protein